MMQAASVPNNVPLSVKNSRSTKDGGKLQQDQQLLSSKIAAFNFHATTGNSRSKQQSSERYVGGGGHH